MTAVNSRAPCRAASRSIATRTTPTVRLVKLNIVPRRLVSAQTTFGPALAQSRSLLAGASVAAPLNMRTLTKVASRSYADAASGNFLKEPEVEQRVIHVVQNFAKVDAAKVNRNAHFINDLGLDSLDEVELLMQIEDEFAIEMPDSEVEKIHSVDDAVKYLVSHPTAK